MRYFSFYKKRGRNKQQTLAHSEVVYRSVLCDLAHYAAVLGRVNNWSLTQIIPTASFIMDCKKRRYYTNELKKEIIQKVKDGISRSDIQKEYGISKSSLSRWICPPDEIIGNANEETVRRTPIQPIPVGGRDDDDNDNNDNDDDDDDEEIDRIINSHKKRKRDDDDEDDDTDLHKKS